MHPVLHQRYVAAEQANWWEVQSGAKSNGSEITQYFTRTVQLQRQVQSGAESNESYITQETADHDPSTNPSGTNDHQMGCSLFGVKPYCMYLLKWQGWGTTYNWPFVGTSCTYTTAINYILTYSIFFSNFKSLQKHCVAWQPSSNGVFTRITLQQQLQSIANGINVAKYAKYTNSEKCSPSTAAANGINVAKLAKYAAAQRCASTIESLSTDKSIMRMLSSCYWQFHTYILSIESILLIPSFAKLLTYGHWESLLKFLPNYHY